MNATIIREGALLPDVCCTGYGWQVLYVNPPDVGTVWGLCKNPDCPEYQANIGPEDPYRGVKSIMQDELEEATMPERKWISGGQPLTRYTVKLGATTPAPWEVLTAADARKIANEILGAIEWDVLGDAWKDDAEHLRAYADAVDAMTKPPTLDLSVEALAG